MSKIHAVEWNIHGAASMGWNNNYEIKKNFVDELMVKKYHIIILVEFIISKGWDYFQEKLNENRYAWFMTYTSSQNGILLAVSKDEFDIEHAQVVRDMDTAQPEKPDFLQVTVKHNNEPFTIIGTRIRVGDKNNNLNMDFQSRKNQFDGLKDHLTNINNTTLIMGDFNNGSIFNEYNKQYIYSNCARQYYNFQMLWRDVEGKINWNFNTPDKGGTYGNKFSIVTEEKHTKKTYYTKEDHIISKGLDITDCDYKWDFVKAENGYGSLNYRNFKSKMKGLPDHAMLVVDIDY